MPECEVRERHSVSVSAPAEITLAAAHEISFQDSRIARAVFALRALPVRLLGAPPGPTERRPLLAEMIALGWLRSPPDGDQLIFFRGRTRSRLGA